MYNQQNLCVTPIADLLEASRGTLVQLPPFKEGTPFIARLKRPSMLALVNSGKIPNSLLTTANKLFSEGKTDVEDLDMMGNLFSILDTLCEACFVEPKYSELKDAGVELTDDQFMFIFSYTQQGVDALRDFRGQSENPGLAENGPNVAQVTK